MSDESIFAEALAIHCPTKRAAYLKEACDGNSRLRRDVEALLAAHAGGNPLDDRPAGLAAVSQYDVTAADPPPAAVGDHVGPYRLMEQIGEGGFGLVFVAEQHEPIRRKVALKVLKPGMDTRQVVARFEAERQALALMSHPNIAKVFDAGSTSNGRPYFVMELVHGIPITEFCDQQRLSPRDRLALFVQVCQAVQHAHQKGVIHRDLKPSNVLVAPHDGIPVVKVIDFGVAKALGQSLTEKTVYTQFAQMIGTPLYMSPEQAEVNQLDVDTRSDIYSLGVLLYELLTGTTPFDSQRFRTAALDEIRRIIREEDPPKPSTRLTSLGASLKSVSSHRGTEASRLSGLVRGELDWIVMKCLEKERTRRYDSAAGLHKDVQRYLDGEAVEACPPTLHYRMSKAYRKHRAAILTAGSFAAVLLVASAVSLMFGITSKQAEARALAQEQIAASSARQARENEQIAQQALEHEKEVREQLEQVEYAQSMQLAYQNWLDNNVAAANKLLEDSKPGFRDWEWNFLNRHCRAELMSFRLDRYPGNTSVDSDLTLAVTGERSDDFKSHTVKLWDLRTGAVIHELLKTPNQIVRLRFDPAGSQIITIQQPVDLDDPPPGDVQLWDATSGKLSMTFQEPVSQVSDAAFNSDSSRVVTANRGGTVTVWNSSTGEKLFTFQASVENQDRIISVAFSPDDRRISTIVRHAISRSHVLKVWDGQNGTELLSLDDCNACAFSADGNRLATAKSDGHVVVRNAETGTELVSLAGDAEHWSSVSFSHDGSRIVAITNGAMAVWDVHHGEKLQTIKVDQWASTDVWFNHDGTKIFASGARTAQVFDATFNYEPSTFLEHSDSPEFSISSDGRRLVTGSGDGQVKVWDAESQAMNFSFNVDTTMAGDFSGTMRVTTISPDAKLMVTGVMNDNARWSSPREMNCRIDVWNPTTGEPLRQFDLKGIVGGASFSPDSRRLIIWGGGWYTEPSGCWVQVWDTTSWSQLATYREHSGFVFSGNFSPDGKRIVTTGNVFDRTARVWEAETGATLLILKDHRTRNDQFAVWDACFSPDGKRVVSCAEEEAIIRDAETGERILSLNGLTAQVRSVAYSPNGKRIITFSSNEELKVWDALTGHELLKLRNDRFMRPARFSPDGTRILVGGDDGVFVFDSRPYDHSTVQD